MACYCFGCGSRISFCTLQVGKSEHWKGEFALSSRVEDNPTLHYALKEAMKLLVDFQADGESSKKTLEMYFLAAVLRSVSGNKERAARRLGLHRNTLYRRIHELGLDPLVAQLRKTRGKQGNLFGNALRGVPLRAGYAQDVTALTRFAQAKSKAFPQAKCKTFSVSDCGNVARR